MAGLRQPQTYRNFLAHRCSSWACPAFPTIARRNYLLRAGPIWRTKSTLYTVVFA